MSLATKSITADELYAMGDMGRCELVKGEIIHMTPAGADHGEIAGVIFALIWNFVRPRKLGKVYAAETGFTIKHNPDTTRAPDVGFVKKERVPPRGKKGFFEGPPDLAVEVVSFNDLASEVSEKIEQWLSGGTTSVWVVDPRTRTIDVYRRGREVIRYRENDELRDEPNLPGFVLKILEVFESE
jgi:Uma2 family endonuclease